MLERGSGQNAWYRETTPLSRQDKISLWVIAMTILGVLAGGLWLVFR